MAHTRFISITAPAVLFVVTAVVAVALVDRDSTEPLGTDLAIGIFSSLVATMIASLWRFMNAVRWKPSAGIPDLVGLTRVTSKSALTSNEWLQVLRTAKTEFYIAGHSLGKWCSPSNREEFKSHIRRVLDSRGRVTLVMLDLAAHKLPACSEQPRWTAQAEFVRASMCSPIFWRSCNRSRETFSEFRS